MRLQFFNTSRVPLILVLLLSLIFANSCASLLKPNLSQEIVDIKPGNYALDTDHATILFKIDHLGFSKFVGRFNQFQASLDFDPEVVENSKLEATVDMTSVDVNNEKFERALNGSFWFNTKKFPQAYFKTLGAHKLDNNLIRFSGELTFLGVTQPINLDVTVNGAATNLISGEYTLGFSASTTFKRSDFGLDTYIPTVGDEVELEIHTEFHKQ